MLLKRAMTVSDMTMLAMTGRWPKVPSTRSEARCVATVSHDSTFDPAAVRVHRATQVDGQQVSVMSCVAVIRYSESQHNAAHSFYLNSALLSSQRIGLDPPNFAELFSPALTPSSRTRNGDGVPRRKPADPDGWGKLIADHSHESLVGRLNGELGGPPSFFCLPLRRNFISQQTSFPLP